MNAIINFPFAATAAGREQAQNEARAEAISALREKIAAASAMVEPVEETETPSPYEREQEARRKREADLHRDDSETTFKAGRTYWTRSICDHECIYRVEVIRRTAKSVRCIIDGKEVTRRVTKWNGVETFAPFGKYSMSPSMDAARFCKTEG